jgi:hypothetical protein
MYKAVYKIQSSSIDEATQTIFTPFINCYEIHSIVVYVNGLGAVEEGFTIDKYRTRCSFGYEIKKSWSVVFDINYFYMKTSPLNVLDFLIDQSYINPAESEKIVSKHYISGQFALDNGLYKEAVLNFGTVLEGLLNKKLDGTWLSTLIQKYSGRADPSDMEFIKDLRNKVHPNQISLTQDISRRDAVLARNKLEVILHAMTP